MCSGISSLGSATSPSGNSGKFRTSYTFESRPASRGAPPNVVRFDRRCRPRRSSDVESGRRAAAGRRVTRSVEQARRPLDAALHDADVPLAQLTTRRRPAGRARELGSCASERAREGARSDGVHPRDPAAPAQARDEPPAARCRSAGTSRPRVAWPYRRRAVLVRAHGHRSRPVTARCAPRARLASVDVAASVARLAATSRAAAARRSRSRHRAGGGRVRRLVARARRRRQVRVAVMGAQDVGGDPEQPGPGRPGAPGRTRARPANARVNVSGRQILREGADAAPQVAEDRREMTFEHELEGLRGAAQRAFDRVCVGRHTRLLSIRGDPVPVPGEDAFDRPRLVPPRPARPRSPAAAGGAGCLRARGARVRPRRPPARRPSCFRQPHAVHARVPPRPAGSRSSSAAGTW